MKAVTPKKPSVKSTKGMGLLDEVPTMKIGPNVKVKGDMKFEGLLKVDGTVEGQIAAPIESDFILSSTGTFVGDITGLHEAFIDGRVTGDICVEHLTLGSNAVIHGDIVCKSLNVHAKAVIMGQLQVSPKSIIKSRYKPSPPSPSKAVPDAEVTPEDVGDVDADSLNNDNAEPLSPENSNNNAEEAPQLEAEPEDNPATEETAAVVEPKRTYKNILLIHEPQVDFYVGGSMNSSTNITAGERIAEFIENNLELIDEIYVTLDMHHKMHLCQRAFWVDAEGNMPEVNQCISVSDIRNSVWSPRKTQQKDYCVHLLDSQAKYLNSKRNSDTPLVREGGVTIKPEHCSIGSQGGAILPVVNQALTEWSHFTLRNVNYITRDIETEAQLNKHSAAVGESGEVTTFSMSGNAADLKRFNEVYDLSFLKQYAAADKLLICGQAASHCNSFSICDVIVSVIATSVVANATSSAGDDSNEANRGALFPKNVFVLKDVLTTSNDQQGLQIKEPSSKSKVEEFWQILNENGVKISTTIEAFLEPKIA